MGQNVWGGNHTVAICWTTLGIILILNLNLNKCQVIQIKTVWCNTRPAGEENILRSTYFTLKYQRMHISTTYWQLLILPNPRLGSFSYYSVQLIWKQLLSCWKQENVSSESSAELQPPSVIQLNVACPDASAECKVENEGETVGPAVITLHPPITAWAAETQ